MPNSFLPPDDLLYWAKFSLKFCEDTWCFSWKPMGNDSSELPFLKESI